jgi:ribulose 1,5-bisphosphate synthetase/thiazole synthase
LLEREEFRPWIFSSHQASTSKQEAMAAQRTRIAVIGAGIGGLTVAACLLRLGFSVEVYEQALQFAPIGAGIQLTANAMKALGGRAAVSVTELD